MSRSLQFRPLRNGSVSELGKFTLLAQPVARFLTPIYDFISYVNINQ